MDASDLAYIAMEREKLASREKHEAEMRELYEKRTMVMERLASALEHRNEQEFHTVR